MTYREGWGGKSEGAGDIKPEGDGIEPGIGGSGIDGKGLIITPSDTLI